MATDYSNEPFPLILSRLHVGGESGVLEVGEGKDIYKIFFDKGRIVALSSSREEESLSHMIVSSGAASPWDVELVQEVVDTKKGKFLGSLLVDMGLVKQEAIIEQLNKKLEVSLDHLFNSKIDGAIFEQGEPPTSLNLAPSRTTADILISAARSMESPALIDRVLGNMDVHIIVSNDARMRYQQAETTKLEKQILSVAGRSPKIRQIAESNPKIDRFELLRSIFGLVVAGFLEVSDQPAARDSLRIPELKKRPDVNRSMIAEKFKNIGIQEPEEFLELPRNYQKEEVKEQYEHLVSLYHPDQSSRETLSDLSQQLDAIFLELTHCYNLVSSGEKKPAVQPEKPRGAGLEETWVRLKSGSTNYQYALKMLSMRKLIDAIAALQLAIENDPGNSFYLFKLAQVLRRIPERQKEAEITYKKALDSDPLNTDVMTELASLYWENDMKAKAKTIMKQAFSIDPSNTRLQKFWNFLQTSDSSFPLKEILLFIAALVIGFGLASLM